MSDEKDMQLDILGGETPHEQVQAALCTKDDLCKAEADQHEPDCPVEWMLREEMGF